MNAAVQHTVASTVRMPMTTRRIVLTGFMGAGKTTVGRMLAQELGWQFIDLDQHLESRAGATIPELFERHGEAHFRRVESTALASALGHSNVVIALGGGTPEQLTNRLLLEQTPGTVTVYLHAPFPTLFDRCVLQAVSRPVLADPVAAEGRFTLRTPLYQRLARHTISTAGSTPGETTQLILEELADKRLV